MEEWGRAQTQVVEREGPVHATGNKQAPATRGQPHAAAGMDAAQYWCIGRACVVVTSRDGGRGRHWNWAKASRDSRYRSLPLKDRISYPFSIWCRLSTHEAK